MLSEPLHKNLQKESGNATVHALHPHTSRVKDRTVRCMYKAIQQNARCFSLRFRMIPLYNLEIQIRRGKTDTFVLRFLFQTLPTIYRQPRITHNSENDDVSRLGLFGGRAGPTQNTP